MRRLSWRRRRPGGMRRRWLRGRCRRSGAESGLSVGSCRVVPGGRRRCFCARGAPGAAFRHYPGVMKTFEDLFAELECKVSARPAGSATVEKLDRGVHFIGKKLVEEAAESWMACKHESDEAACVELSQLLYHVQVMMIDRDRKSVV